MRIEARRLDDGRIEFALRERGGERILPPARYFPAETEAGRWLNASWITVGAGDEFAAAPPTATPGAATTSPPSVWTPFTFADDLTGELSTTISSVATKWTDDDLGGYYAAPQLTARCDPTTGFKVFVHWDSHITTSARASQRSSTTGRGAFAVDGGSVQGFAWTGSKRNEATFAAFPEEVADWLRNGSDRIVIRVYNHDGESLTATFPIGGYAQAERAHLSCR